MKTYQYYAGGNWHDPATGQWIDSENPALGEVWARVPDCNADDINPVSYTHLTLPTNREV